LALFLFQIKFDNFSCPIIKTEINKSSYFLTPGFLRLKYVLAIIWLSFKIKQLLESQLRVNLLSLDEKFNTWRILKEFPRDRKPRISLKWYTFFAYYQSVDFHLKVFGREFLSTHFTLPHFVVPLEVFVQTRRH